MAYAFQGFSSFIAYMSRPGATQAAMPTVHLGESMTKATNAILRRIVRLNLCDSISSMICPAKKEAVQAPVDRSHEVERFFPKVEPLKRLPFVGRRRHSRLFLKQGIEG